MTWKNIKVAADNTHFLENEKAVFNRQFIEVLKFHAPGIAPVKDEKGAYHIDFLGKDLYTQKYDRTFGFYCNRAAVIEKGLWFHIDEKGNAIYEEKYAWCGNFQEDISTVRNLENRYFHININGDRIYTQTYVYAGDFKDGYACVKLDNGLYKHIDTNGKYLNDKSFKDLGIFHKNIATAKDEKGWFHIDKFGNALYAQRYLFIEPFYNGFALVTAFDDSKLVIDEAGQKIVEIG